MEPIKLAGTSSHPEIDFDFDANRFFIGGYSYPENVKTFYDPVIDPLNQHLRGLSGATIEFRFAFNYFHSSTAQVLYSLFDRLDNCADAGNTVSIIWLHQADDEDMQEMGADFGDDLDHASFVTQVIEED
ncbi:DUF1987 domain-containing protein [Magnetospira sp. QH-2]|uniref:DUF1987 domain-containing protein n=1 Tax=Magnetospira sp. (strain QH-2) TaxID=1288970 RepID=UPI0003E80D68|nr:DUF1987 domain-containing protein [Magnetospira sp. QH-2]CCQ75543.1 Conserved protein of unknown function [Magnetospira sp. QH-2]